MSIVAKLLRDLHAEVKRTAEETGVKPVHDLRVAVRRVTAALRVYQDEVPRAKRLKKEIRQVREHAATVRDRDVIRDLLRRHRLSASDAANVYLSGQRDLAAAQLRDFLRRIIEKDRPQRWFDWIGKDP
ncbi:MAG: CHAD domain-containing protein [Acidobacteria bacterium]|nr:CHAD domain-containing protein [Acidobacteriota bacterium]